MTECPRSEALKVWTEQQEPCSLLVKDSEALNLELKPSCLSFNLAILSNLPGSDTRESQFYGKKLYE